MNVGRLFTRRLFATIGSVVALGCLAFFLKALLEAVSAIGSEHFGTYAIIVTAALCPCYGAILVLPANSWKILLRLSAPAPAPGSHLVGIYALTLIAKYIPGNVFHLVGRHTILARQGFPQRALLVSAFQENVALAASAGLVGLVLITLIPSPAITALLQAADVPQVLLSMMTMRAIGAAVFVVICIPVAIVAFGRLAHAPSYRPLMLDSVFFMLQGLFFTFIVHAVTGTVRLEALGAVILSWVAGFLMPGAPGGVGVREIVLIFLLNGTMGRDELVLAAALYRIVTLGGDVLFFGYGVLRARLGNRARPNRSDAVVSLHRNLSRLAKR